ncbi:hypothetical protein AQJ66_11750 [Streptomyces bungoensis]|uniref:Uncharacterized protein n=1 Tax=Streptomyces bungoensis TaxID=285568 RepID=A0A101T6P2_9ACTN|nr:DUF6215 domain-containing protein [Streptomyces bungoensis]KUN86695.1 hypothetical protein AQJ66_11750 [Streptomyces bungoensis]
MLGLLLRLLPFWVREPLFIVIGSVLGLRLGYLAVHDHDRVAAVFGVVFLGFTAVRVHTVVRALRARRNPGPARAQAPIQAPAQAQAAAGPRPAPGAPEKDHNAWGQAVAAVAVFGALAATIWLSPHLMPSDDTTPRAASCSDTEHEALPKAYRKTPRAVTGDDLCKALNRPDLARLLGTPGETATTASGSNGTAALTDEKVARPEAEIMFDTYTVNLSAAYDRMSTAQYVKLIDIAGDRVEDDVKTLKVLGRPAVFSSDHTMKIEFRLGGGQKSAPVQQGPLARTLSVALDRKDRGGSYDITVWSKSGALPSDSALLGIAEKVLPAIPERSAH